MKTIFEKMNEEKKIYLEENTKMASELLEVKDLLSKTIGGWCDKILSMSTAIMR